jgi:hypothetical protein
MSTLRIRAVHAPQLSPHPAFARTIFAIATVIDVFAEAQALARAAQKRYPFIEG